MTATLTIPGLRLYSLNAREHWAKKAKRVKAERSAVSFAWASRRCWSDAARFDAEPPYVVTVTRIAPRPIRDAHDNLPGAAKHVVDQIAAELGVDDGDTSSVAWVYAQKLGKYGVSIQVRSRTRVH